MVDRGQNTGADIMPDLGLRLVRLREKLGLSQRELARRAGMPNGNLSQIEQGKVSPTVHSLQRILAAANVSIAEFFAAAAVDCSPVIKDASFALLQQEGATWRYKMAENSTQCPLFAKLDIAPQKTATWPWLTSLSAKNAYKCFVLQGSLKFIFDTAVSYVEGGDALSFSSVRSLQIANSGEELARLVICGFELTPD